MCRLALQTAAAGFVSRWLSCIWGCNTPSALCQTVSCFGLASGQDVNLAASPAQSGCRWPETACAAFMTTGSSLLHLSISYMQKPLFFPQCQESSSCRRCAACKCRALIVVTWCQPQEPCSRSAFNEHATMAATTASLSGFGDRTAGGPAMTSPAAVRREAEAVWECMQRECQRLLALLLHATSGGSPTKNPDPQLLPGKPCSRFQPI